MKDLTINDIELPKQVVDAIEVAYSNGQHIGAGSPPFQPKFWAKVALLAITKEPVAPSKEDVEEMMFGMRGLENLGRTAVEIGASLWQRRMFLRKPDPVLDEVKALLFDGTHMNEGCGSGEADRRILDAFELGKRLGAETRAK